MRTKTDKAVDNRHVRGGKAGNRARELLVSILSFERKERKLMKKFGDHRARHENRAEGLRQPRGRSESESDMLSTADGVEIGGKRTEKERDDEEAEGLTPAVTGPHASKGAGGGAMSRLWVNEISETEDREKLGEEMETARRVEQNKGIRMGITREKGRDRMWQEETRERRTRARNVVVRGVKDGEEEVDERVPKWLEQELGRRVEIEQIWVAKGKQRGGERT